MKAAFVNLILRFLSRLSLPTAHLLGYCIGKVIYIFPNRIKKIVAVNLKLCFPAIEDQKQNQLIQNVLIESAKTLIELGPIWYWPKEKILKTVINTTGEDVLNSAIQSGKGVILVLPHLGCWEIIGLYCSNIYPMTSLFRPPRLHALAGFMSHARQRCGGKLVPTNAQGIRSLYQALKRGEIACILPDQDPGKGKGVFAPFFGVPTNTMTLLSRLALKTHAHVVFAFAIRLPKGRGYHIYFKPESIGIGHGSVKQSVYALNANIEECVSICMEQYQWGYKRFKYSENGRRSGLYVFL